MRLPFQTYTIIILTLIAGTALATGWAFFHLENNLAGISGGMITATLIIHLVLYQQKALERINYFFEAVKNEDSALSFPKRKNDKILNQLSCHLEKINAQLRKLKTETRQREQFLKAIIEHVETGILTFDKNGFVHNANNALKQTLKLRQITHLRQLEKIHPQLANVISSMQPRDQKMLTLNIDQQKAVNLLMKSTSFKKGNQSLMLVSIQDINEQLNEKELDSWMKLIRILTHEIMNSIAPITSLSENLKSYYVKNKEIINPDHINKEIIKNTVKGLDVIEQQGKGLINFVESYRKLTRLPAPELKTVDIKNLIEDTVMLNKSLWPDIQISLQIQDADLRIQADENLLAQVIINLLKNASEALEGRKDGKITVSIAKSQQNRVQICIKDNGPGIPPEIMEEIFIPFFTTREKGSGIGLSLSRQIVRLHRGRLTVKSHPGEETVFCIEIG